MKILRIFLSPRGGKWSKRPLYRSKTFFLCCMLLLGFPNLAFSASWETLLMPGELIQGHKKYEETCTECHSRLNRVSQTTQCSDCHKKVAKDVDNSKGFHGRIKNIKHIECRTCHTDHKGRKADVVNLNKETFNHNETDYPLKGQHTQVACKKCHKKKKYREAKSKCIGCHKKDDAHDKKMDKDCAKCHNPKTWKKNKFDHDKTKFKLIGKHKKIACNDCHPNRRYKDIPKKCLACHRINDNHNNLWGEKCKDCHTPKAWDKLSFKHDKDTKFKLSGRHKKVDCKACHIKSVTKQKERKNCIECHKHDDTHQKRYGNKCKECHSTKKHWKKFHFDHDKDTDYRLEGKHKKVTCDACHTDNIEEEDLKTTCISCHKARDVHQGQEGEKCKRCHNTHGWQKNIIFDHGVTRFPLIGLHSMVSCDECHIGANFKNAATQCQNCHANDDIHKQKLGPTCHDCHNPNDWGIWHFDHDKETEYKLDGKHAELDCHACHKDIVLKRPIILKSDCIPCHRWDDAHQGAFGQWCDYCHTTEKFNQIIIR